MKFRRIVICVLCILCLFASGCADVKDPGGVDTKK